MAGINEVFRDEHRNTIKKSSQLVPYNELCNLEDYQKTSNAYFNNLRRNEKAGMVDFNVDNPNVLILPASPYCKLISL